jgi:hypothetical protein
MLAAKPWTARGAQSDHPKSRKTGVGTTDTVKTTMKEIENPVPQLNQRRGWVMWAFVTPNGELLPSTIRERRGDSLSALGSIHFPSRPYTREQCKAVRVAITV